MSRDCLRVLTPFSPPTHNDNNVNNSHLKDVSYLTRQFNNWIKHFQQMYPTPQFSPQESNICNNELIIKLQHTRAGVEAQLAIVG